MDKHPKELIIPERLSQGERELAKKDTILFHAEYARDTVYKQLTTDIELLNGQNNID